MAVQHTQVMTRLKDLRQKYYAALKRQDIDGFLREIAIQQLEQEQKSEVETT